MGTAVAPNYANLFMNRFESKALANWPLKPFIWLRFTDDIFMIWTHGEDTLTEFITYLNGIHPTIKFAHEPSTTQINFLDTTVKVNSPRELYTTLYKNPQTPTCTYTTLHPIMHQVKLIGQLLRHICTYDTVFQDNTEKLVSYYIKRGYPEKALRKHYSRASKYSQDKPLKVVPKNQIDTSSHGH